MSEKKGLFSGLFGGKKSGGCCNMEIVEESTECGCSGGCCGTDAQEGTDTAPILVLGTGCKNCQTLEANVKEALAKMGKDVAVGHVTELDKIAAYGIMSTPGLVVNGKVVSSGKVLKADAIVEILEKNL